MKKLSIVTPLYKTPKRFLDDVLESVRPYAKDIELVLVNDSPSSQRLGRMLKQVASEDVKVFYNEKNLGIFASYHRGFLHATGEYCCILDHDDIFDPEYVLEALERKPDLLFTDEYKFYDENGSAVKTDPFNKPEFDILSTVFYFYTHHVTVLKTAVLQRQLKAYQGSNKYTSVFDIHMLLEYLTAFVGKEMNVIHIPREAYGWRIHPNSTAYRLDQKISGYFERIKKTEEFLTYFGETPLLNLDPNIGYLVDGEFLSAHDQIPYPMEIETFEDELKEKHGFRGEKLSLRLQDGVYTQEDYLHFFKMLRRLPVLYLQKQRCLPLLIPCAADVGTIDTENAGKHVPNVPFLSRVSIPQSGLLLYETGAVMPEAKYTVLIRKN